MRHGWEIKKLGEVCEIERGGSPRPIKEYLTDSQEGINWIKIGDADGSKYITKTKEKIKPEGIKKSRYVYSGDFLLSNSMSFGRPYILAIDGCIHDGWLVIHDTNNYFNKSYLYYYLGSSNIYQEFKRLAVGGVVNNLNTEIVKNVKVYIPPLSEQERIVAELDLLSDVIAKKREQLKQLDTLAQSIFYDMFGDPITNEKGWRKEKITKIAPIEPYQGDISGINGMYWLLNLDMIQSNKCTIHEKVYVQYDEVGTSTIKFNKDNVLYSKLRPYLNKVVIPNDSGYCTSELVPFKPFENIILKIFLCYVLSHKSFVNYISSKVIGAKMPRVSMDALREFNVITPPLPLQQQFASKIEAIEKQKELIKQSLSEVQQLFDSRMDYYFG